MKIFYPILFFCLAITNHENLWSGYEKLQEEIQSISNSFINRNFKLSCHHLPKNDQEHASLMASYWKGIELYDLKKYNESIEYFLIAEQYYLPSCLEYLYHFIEHQENYFKKGVSQENIDLIISRLPENINFQTLYDRYRKIFMESQLTSDKIYKKNQTGKLNINGLSFSSKELLSFYGNLTKNLTSIINNFLPKTTDKND